MPECICQETTIGKAYCPVHGHGQQPFPVVHLNVTSPEGMTSACNLAPSEWKGTNVEGDVTCLACRLTFDVTHWTPSEDMVNHPPHYNTGKFEVIEVIEDWKLGFCLGNAVKYIARAEHKGKQLEDLKKARWYLDREIQRLEREE